MKPDETLKQLAGLYQFKNSVYGDSYKQAGYMLHELFPKGITLDKPEAFNRFCIIVHIITKLHRYCNNFDNADEPDHMKDISVYATMLLELDCERKV
jgi:hypothetical protein